MSIETVRVFCEDQAGDPIVGVLVRFFEADGTTFVTQQYSVLVGLDAYAEVTLTGDDPAVTYVIRLSKSGVAFDGTLGAGSYSPQTIAVSSLVDNDFDVFGQTFTHPVASDPRLCRVSGHVYDHKHQPLENYRISLSPFVPDSAQQSSMRVVDGDLIANKRQYLVTDSAGYVVFDVMRGAEYLAFLEDNVMDPRELHIPDASSAVLTDLLFPTIRSVVFVTPMNLSVGESATATVTIVSTDARVFTPTDQVVDFVSSDESVAVVSIVAGEVVVTAVSAGTAVITATLVDTTVLRYPNEPQTLVPLTVVVS